MTKPCPCPDEMVAFAQLLADTVRPIIRKHFRTRLAIDAKADLSPVTIVDRAAETVMREMIGAEFPEHGIRGEEFGVHRPDAEWVWVLDPIDGTKSFISGSLNFGTQIALVHRGTPVLGIIDQPITQERWIGRYGQPTLLGEAVLHTSATTSVANAILYTSAWEQFTSTQHDRFATLAAAAQVCRTSHDCYAAGLLAHGCVDILAEANVFDYDILPQLPIVVGAGAVVSDWDGNPLSDNSKSFPTVLMSANAQLHEIALTCLKAQTN